jgi:hypothetical protein
LNITNNEIVQHSKSEPKKFSILCTFKGQKITGILLLGRKKYSRGSKNIEILVLRMKKHSWGKEKNTCAKDERSLMWRKSIGIIVLRIKEC